jgi:lipid-binding SYLF domain-containing protein
MFRRNHLVPLVLGLLFVFATTVSAQDNQCGCKMPAPAPSVSTQGCGCAPVPAQKAEVPPPQRQKPYAEAKPERSIAPRDLPVVYQGEMERAIDAANVLADFPNKGMLCDARAIAVIPGVKKAAFGFGVRWGRGLMTMRDEDGNWLPPTYISITGGNFGFQAGIQSTDLVLIFSNTGGVRSVLRGKLTLNADASAAAGPFGRKLQGGVPILMNSGILAFSRSKGLFAGVSLDGAAITIDDTANSRVYGKYISGDQILLDRRVEPNVAVAPFLNALATYSPGPNQPVAPATAAAPAGTPATAASEE